MGKGIIPIGVAILGISLLASAPVQQQPEALSARSSVLGRLFEQGTSLSAQGDFKEAYRTIVKAREVARESGFSRDEAVCLMRLGMIAWNLGRIGEAESYFRAGIALTESRSDSDLRALLSNARSVVDLYNLGKALRSKNLFEDSVQSFDKAIRIAREIKIADFDSKCLRQQSLAFWQMDDLMAYLSCNERASGIAHDLHNAAEEGKSLNNIGVYYEKICDYSKAMTFFEKALEVAQGGGDKGTVAECLTNLGVVYLRLNDFARAEVYFAQAVEIDEGLLIGKSVAMDYNNLGVAVLKRISLSGQGDGKELGRAQSLFDQCRVLLIGDDDPYTRLLAENNLGYVHYLRKEYTKAIWRFRRCMSLAKALQNTYMMSTIAINLAHVCLDQGRVAEAIDHLKRGIDYGTPAGAGDLLWEAYSGLGRCFEKLDDMPQALRYYERAMAAIEKTGRQIVSDPFRVGFVRNKSEIFRRAVDLLADQYREKPSWALLSRIFVFVERAKSRAFLDSLSEAEPVVSQALSPAIKKREEEASKRISSLFIRLANPRLSPVERVNLKAELESEEAKYQRILSEVRLANRGLAELIVPSICDLQEVQSRLLDSRTTLLEYFLGDRRSYQIIVTNRRAELRELPGRGTIEDSVRGYLRILSSPPSSSAMIPRVASRIARDLLLSQGSLGGQGVDSLLIVPDGILYSLPFEALMNSGGQEGPPRFLAEDYCMSYSPAASVFTFLKNSLDRSIPPKRFLAVADPELTPPFLTEAPPSQGFPHPLPFSRREALDISAIFEPQQSDVLVGEEANEAVIKKMAMDDYGVIHFACHGLIDIAHPYRSALILSKKGSGSEDGYLQAREIYLLRTHARLVVLSACETAAGPLESFEGLMGLPRAFFCAGARSVLSSLWPVYDQSTADFMKGFYRAAAAGTDISQALRAAKRRAIHSSVGHPFYWAGFVLAGYPGPVTLASESAR